MFNELIHHAHIYSLDKNAQIGVIGMLGIFMIFGICMEKILELNALIIQKTNYKKLTI
jgi:hypothetical protein